MKSIIEVSGHKHLLRDRPTLLGYRLLGFGFMAPSAIHDHLTGTQIILDKVPDKNLVITVSYNKDGKAEEYSKLLLADKYFSNWTPIHSEYNSSLGGYRYIDGKHNLDWFGLDGIYHGTNVTIKLAEEIPVEASVWNDDALWIDSMIWKEEVTEVVWNDNLLWNDATVWLD